MPFKETWMAAKWRRWDQKGYSDVWEGPCLVNEREGYPDRLYWGEGPTHMHRPNAEAEFTILHTFGTVEHPIWIRYDRHDPDEMFDVYSDATDRFRVEFDLMFPPDVGDVTENEAWISPEGAYYPCGYGEHTGLAKRLENVFYANDADRAISDNAEEFLRARGWIAIRAGGVSLEWKDQPDGYERPTITPQQLAVLQTIEKKLQESGSEKTLKEGMQRLMRRTLISDVDHILTMDEWHAKQSNEATAAN